MQCLSYGLSALTLVKTFLQLIMSQVTLNASLRLRDQNWYKLSRISNETKKPETLADNSWLINGDNDNNVI